MGGTTGRGVVSPVGLRRGAYVAQRVRTPLFLSASTGSPKNVIGRIPFARSSEATASAGYEPKVSLNGDARILESP